MAGKPQPKKEYVQEGSGRPSKFTPERRAAIIDAIYHRIPYEMAAEANGICLDTLYEWFKIGKEHSKLGISSDYTIFSEALKRAEMQKVREHLDIISARPERWQADSWILERRWHKYFSNNASLIDLNKRLSNLEGDSSHGEENEERSQEND
jgi:hypothetical protein